MYRPESHIVVIQETNENWSGLLRRQLAADDISVIRVENLDELSGELMSAGRGCFAVRVDEHNASATLNWLYQSKQRYPEACFCGISIESLDAWTVYEAGAALVIRHPLDILSLAGLVRRYFAARLAPKMSAGSEITTESVWLSLPWYDQATLHLAKRNHNAGRQY